MTGTNRLLQDTVDDLARAGWGAREFYVTLAEFERAVRQPPWYAWLRYAGVLLAAASLFLILWITLKDDCKRQVEEAKRENARLRPDGTAVTHADLKLIADRLVVLEKAPPKGQEPVTLAVLKPIVDRVAVLEKPPPKGQEPVTPADLNRIVDRVADLENAARKGRVGPRPLTPADLEPIKKRLEALERRPKPVTPPKRTERN